MTGKTASKMKSRPVAFDLWERFIHGFGITIAVWDLRHNIQGGYI